MLVDVMKYSLVILIIIILYRLLLRYLNRKQIRQENYCKLHDLEYFRAKGEIPFYFSLETVMEVEFFIKNSDGEEFVVSKQTYEPGGHIVRYDTNALPNGRYEYGLKTKNQESRKVFRIEN